MLPSPALLCHLIATYDLMTASAFWRGGIMPACGSLLTTETISRPHFHWQWRLEVITGPAQALSLAPSMASLA